LHAPFDDQGDPAGGVRDPQRWSRPRAVLRAALPTLAHDQARSRLVVWALVIAGHGLLLWALDGTLDGALPDDPTPHQVLTVRFIEAEVPPRPAPPQPPVTVAPVTTAPTPPQAASRPVTTRPTPADAPAIGAAAPAPSPDALPGAIAQSPLDLTWRAAPSAEPAPQAFNGPAGQSLAETMQRKVTLPGTRSRLDPLWKPDGETALAELARRSTVTREFKDPWGGRWRCVIPFGTIIVGVCNFAIPQAPLKDAPLAPNEAPRAGRTPLRSPGVPAPEAPGRAVPAG